jgi:threonine dehydrogenase-like Zn-dependent dehydrogenase
MFDHSIGLDEIPDGYGAMADRQALKVMIRP